jgi:hypothetical protein
MTDETLRWDESMWRATPPTPISADVIRWPAEADKWVRQKAAIEPTGKKITGKQRKAADFAAIRLRIMDELRRRTDSVSSEELSAELGMTTDCVASHLKYLRKLGRVQFDPASIALPNGHHSVKRWVAVQKPSQD